MKLSNRLPLAARLSLLACGMLLATSCATSSDLEKLQSQISDMQEQIAQLKRTASSKEEVQNVNTKIAEQTQTLLKSNATLVVKVDQIEDKMNNGQGAVEQTNYRLDHLAQQVTQQQHDLDEMKAQAAAAAARAAAATPIPPAVGGAPAITTAPPPGTAMTEMNVAPPVTGEDPLRTYQEAYRDYQRGNFDLAIGGFHDYIKGNPNSDLADNAAYWIGESLFSQKKYREAIQQFDSVVTKYPRSDKVPGALLKKGYAYISIGERAQGIVQLQYVVHEHGNTQEAKLAREKLKQLGVDSK